MPVLRQQFFCQVVQKDRRQPDGCQGLFVQDDGKRASKTGAEPSGVIYSVIP